MDINEVKNKMMGCLYGQAIGDALGLGTEFMSKAEIARYYPDTLKKYEDIRQDSHRKRWIKGDWTDDTDMMLCLLKAFDENGFHYLKAAENFKEWLDGCPMGIGRHTIKVLICDEYTQSPFEVSKLMWELTRCNSAANGALMRTSVMGLWYPHNNDWVADACLLTHYDPRCVISCQIASELINSLVWDGSELSLSDILVMSNNSELRDYVKLAYSSKHVEMLELAKQPGIGYTYRTLAAGLWCYWHSSSFEEGLLTIVNEGGDADTNAAVACAILGAKFGYNAIPKYYIENLYYENDYRKKCESFINFAIGSYKKFKSSKLL